MVNFTICIFSVQFSHSVVSDSLRPHELQHATGLISLSLVLLSFWFPWKAPSFFWCLKCKTNNFESRVPLPSFRSAQLSAPWCFLSVSITSCTGALFSLCTVYASPALGPLVSLSLWACHIRAGGAAVT